MQFEIKGLFNICVFLLCQGWGLACILDKPIDQILPFAEYHRSMFWPYGRVLKNSTDYHGECIVNSNLVLMYLGSTLDQSFQRMKLLRPSSDAELFMSRT